LPFDLSGAPPENTVSICSTQPFEEREALIEGTTVTAKNICTLSSTPSV
jgi:hypothetical protein